MFDLTGKTALVTGASGGIGAGIARALHAQGACVALSGTRREALEALAGELGERTAICPADLRNPEAPDALIAEVEGALAAPWHFCHSAPDLPKSPGVAGHGALAGATKPC